MINENYTGAERRQRLRIVFEEKGLVIGKKMDGSMFAATCHFANLSESGACFKTNIPVTENSELDLNFKLPGLLNIKLHNKAKVVWCSLQPEKQCYLSGVVFKSFQVTALCALRSYIFIQNRRGNVFEP